jgi:cytochrome c oxidase subunit 3
MSAAVTHEHDVHAVSHELPPAEQLKANRLGLWLFCISELFLFVGLFAARFYLWRDGTGASVRPDLNQGLALATTSVLLVSSYFMVRAETAITYNDRQKFLNSLVVTFVLGFLFLFGVVFFEWGLFEILRGHEPHIRPGDGAFGAMFFAMTGMHAIHVITGLIFIGVVWRNGRRGSFSADDHWGVEACAIYWHYVDVIWVFFYPALYLIGRAVEIAH